MRWSPEPQVGQVLSVIKRFSDEKCKMWPQVIHRKKFSTIFDSGRKIGGGGESPKEKPTSIREEFTNRINNSQMTSISVGIGAQLCKALVEAGMIVCGMSKRKDKMEVND